MVTKQEHSVISLPSKKMNLDCGEWGVNKVATCILCRPRVVKVYMPNVKFVP